MANRLVQETPPGMDAALDAAARLVESSPRPQHQAEPAQTAEPQTKRYVNLRFKGDEYKQIGHIATDAGLTNTAFCKMAVMFMADLVKSGIYSVNAGGFVPQRR
jgi:hypothetical protein